MTSRIGHSIEGHRLQIEKSEWKKHNIDLLTKHLLLENIENMGRIRDGNPAKRKERLERQQKFMARRIFTVFG